MASRTRSRTRRSQFERRRRRRVVLSADPHRESSASDVTGCQDSQPLIQSARRHGQAVDAAIRQRALEWLASGLRRSEVAKRIGVTTESLRLWRVRAIREGTFPPPDKSTSKNPPPPLTNPVHAPTAPRDPGTGLGEHEREAILEIKKRHASMGPAQIRTQLKRFKGWRLSTRAIARVLTQAGYELVHRGSRPKGDEHPHRWEAPRRNALWQIDFAELRVGPERVSVLLVQDDFSRFIVGHGLLEEPSSEKTVEILKQAIHRHGKPEAVYTDRGGAFLAWRNPSGFQQFLEAELIDHHVSSPYRPQGRGKIESLIQTLQRELWQTVEFLSVDQAREALDRFVESFNHHRAHMGIDGLVPADRFSGRAEQVLARMQAASRHRQGLVASDPFTTEERPDPRGPFEVLRLVVLDDHMELRFLGHRVVLGKLEV